jgi:hypothetical protein
MASQGSEPQFVIDTFLKNALLPVPQQPSEDDFVALCQDFQRKYSNLPNLLSITQPLTVVGAVHAQLDDIHELFDVCGEVPFTSYLFLGDFVN